MVLSEDSDRLYVERAKRGEVDAFEHLYRRYVRQVYGVCRRLLESSEDAEDMTQRAFLRGWRRLGSYRGESCLGTWLRRIAVNLVIDERRASWRQQLEELRDADLERWAAPPVSAGAGVDLERAVAQLAPGARRVLVLHDIEGYTHAEIAALLGVTVGTTKTQLFRARKTLKECLQ